MGARRGHVQPTRAYAVPPRIPRDQLVGFRAIGPTGRNPGTERFSRAQRNRTYLEPFTPTLRNTCSPPPIWRGHQKFNSTVE